LWFVEVEGQNINNTLPSYCTLTFKLEEVHLKDQKEEDDENNTHEEEASQKLAYVLLL